MSTQRQYTVEVRRDPEDTRFWLADVKGLPGAHTSSRSLASLERFAREVIVLAADLPESALDGLELEWRFATGDPDTDRETARLRRRRDELDAANRDLADATRALALRLVTARGFSVRDAALLLSISAARVDQMVRESRRHRAA